MQTKQAKVDKKQPNKRRAKPKLQVQGVSVINARRAPRDSTTAQIKFAQANETPKQAMVRKSNSTTGIDSRDPNTTTGTVANNLEITQENVLKVLVPIEFKTLAGIGISCLSMAYQQGFQAVCDAQAHPEYPYAAFLFITRFLENAIQSRNTGLTTVPNWMKVLYDILLPKRVPFEAGIMAYSWQYTPSTANYTWVQSMAPYSVNPARQTCFLYPSATLTDGWQQLTGDSQPNPDEDAQLIAYNALVTHMSSREGVSGTMWSLVDLNGESPFRRNISAFSWSEGLLGSGQGGAGYWGGVVYNESFIANPLFACFAAPQVSLQRSFRDAKLTAGDTIYLAKQLTSVSSYGELRTKRPLVARPVDFYFLAHTYFKILAEAFNQYYRDMSVVPEFGNFGISVQDALVLFRQCMMDCFASTQSAVQGIVYRTENNNTPQPVRPLVCGPGTCGTGSVQLQGPQFMVENIRLLQGRRTVPKAKSGKLIYSSPEYLLPVLVATPGQRLDPLNYTYVDRDGNTAQIFANYPASDYIELTTGTSSNNFLSLNYSPKLQLYLSIFNKVYAALSRYILGSATFDAELGINALQVISMARMVQTAPTLAHPEPRVVRGAIVLSKTTLQEGETTGLLDVISQQPFNKTAYDQVQANMIMPEYTVYTVPAPSGAVTTPIIRTRMGDAYCKHLTDEVANNLFTQSKGDFVRRYVSLCVAPFGTRENEINELFDEVTKHGQGGFLSELVSAFTPVVGQVVGGVTSGLVRGVMPMSRVGQRF